MLKNKQVKMIKKSVELDELRWKDEKESLSNKFAGGLYDNYDNEVRYLKWFLSHRLNYLASAWGVTFEHLEEPASTGIEHTVTFENADDTKVISIMDGETLGDNIPEGMWVIKGTWNPINRYIPVYEDMTMTLWEKEE